MSVYYCIFGLLSGTLSGIIGLGAGIFIPSSLVYLFGFSQKPARGAIPGIPVPPIGILAALTDHKQ